jgi:hypothetical protein
VTRRKAFANSGSASALQSCRDGRGFQTMALSREKARGGKGLRVSSKPPKRWRGWDEAHREECPGAREVH